MTEDIETMTNYELLHAALCLTDSEYASRHHTQNTSVWIHRWGWIAANLFREMNNAWFGEDKRRPLSINLDEPGGDMIIQTVPGANDPIYAKIKGDGTNFQVEEWLLNPQVTREQFENVLLTKRNPDRVIRMSLQISE